MLKLNPMKLYDNGLCGANVAMAALILHVVCHVWQKNHHSHNYVEPIYNNLGAECTE